MRHPSPTLTTLCAILAAALAGLAGCRALIDETAAYQFSQQQSVPNPLTVAMVDRDWIMDAVSDELDNYFRIYREERIRLVDNILTEGWIETHPQIGGTALEPWRRDSTRGFERTHATLQTIRRYAKVRVIPHYDSYLIDVRVYKELEDRTDPLNASVTSRMLRHDNSLDSHLEELQIANPNKGWIPLGPDLSLEQLILKNIASRVEEKCAAQR